MAIAFGLLHPVEIDLPRLPRSLEGLRIAHLSDLHIRRTTRLLDRLESQLTSQRFDLIVLTGDYMNWPYGNEEPRARDALDRLCRRLRPKLGIFGVFGNHDTPRLRDQCAALGIDWLGNDVRRIEGRPIELLGLDMAHRETTDAVELAARLAADPADHTPAPAGASNLEADERPLRLMLTHTPGPLPTAADLDVDLMLCGHMHGGQCRLPTGHALVNASDFPLHLTAGLLRHRDTLAGISRGIGWVGFAPRVFCRPHVPVYTLRRGPLPGTRSDTIENLRPW